MSNRLDGCPIVSLNEGAFSFFCGRPRPGFPRLIFLALFLLCVFCAACGAVGPASDPPPAVTITVTPTSAQIYQGNPVQFMASVQNAAASSIVWQVNGVANGNPTVGTIDSTGLYVAPAAVPTPATVMVTAALQTGSTKSGPSDVTILLLSSITGHLLISPALSSVTTSQALQLQVTTPGVTNSDVSWAASGGTISADGVFNPPSAPGPYTILASLLANPNTTGSATVEVTDFPGMLTWRNDNSRSGINSQELALTPGNVNSSSFGKLFSCLIDGYAYGQPLYVSNLPIPGKGTHNVIFVATEKDSVYAFDADAGPCVQLWVQNGLIPSGSQAIETPNLQITSPAIVRFVGITGTPVISMTTSALYVVVATETIPVAPNFNPTYSQLLYALDLATGQKEIQPTGAEISAPEGRIPSFYAALENQRPALLLDNGTVYVAFGSLGGDGDYHGWLFGYDSSTLQQTGAFDVTADAVEGGIWQSGGGPSADPNHNVFVVTGNGPFNANRGLNSYGNSFLRFGTGAGLTVADYFTPCDEETLLGEGLDVGASAPVLLPDSAGSSSQPHLLIGGSKAGFLYVVNRDNMGKFTPPLPSSLPCSDSPASVQKISAGGGPILSTPLFWNNSVYVAPGNGNFMSFPMLEGILASAPSAGNLKETLGPQGSTPTLSANGTSNAILWLIDASGAEANSPAILRAYDPENLSNEIYNSAAAAKSRDQSGPAVKFTVPTVANGKVYVGTQKKLDVYGLL